MSHEIRNPNPTQADVDAVVDAVAKRNYAQAERLAREMTQVFPNHPMGWKALGVVSVLTGKVEQALAPMQRCVELSQHDAEALSNLGHVLANSGRFSEAEASCRKAIALKPDYAEAHNNLGNALRDLLRLSEAEASCRQAIALKPDYAEAHSNLGVTLMARGRPAQAQASYRQAIALKPNYAEAHSNLGNVLKDLGHLSQAEESYRQAIALKPDYAEAHSNLGVVLIALGRLSEAAASYRQAIALKPDYVEAHSNLLFGMNYAGSLSVTAGLEEARRYGASVSRKARHKYTAWRCPQVPDKLRIGFVSGDLRNHPVGYFLEGLLSNLDRSRFELIAYTNNPAEDELTARIKTHFTLWRSLVGKRDEAAAELIHDDGVHILIDLAGHSAHNRLPVFVFKPAPVQVSWLGYCATTGVQEIDYLLGDGYVTPAEEDDQFVESVWRLPESYVCLTPPQQEVQIDVLPAQKSGHITFGSFNNLSKMTDAVVSLWARILSSVEQSRLFLKTKQLNDKRTVQQTIERFEMFGIHADRLIIEGTTRSHIAHLEAYNRVDIALDTFPYNGVTTSAEALWMGVPVITKKGDRFIAHNGETIAKNAGLSEWIARDENDYVLKAKVFASDLNALANVRAGLRAQVLSSPLFDSKRFARHFEEAMAGMWDRYIYLDPLRGVLRPQNMGSDPLLQNFAKPQIGSGVSLEDVESKFRQALALHQGGEFSQAQALYTDLLKTQPGHSADALHLLGLIALQTKDPQKALDLIDSAIAVNSSNPAFYSNRGVALKELKQFDAAIASYDRAIAIKPDYAEAFFNRGAVLKELKQFDAAVASYDRAIAFKPDYAVAYFNRGAALQGLKQLEAAMASYDTAIAIRPDYAVAYFNRGATLHGLIQLDAAIASYDKAIAIRPDYAEAYSNRGAALQGLKQLDAAIASYDKAIAIRPDYVEAYSNRGAALQELGFFDAAVASYDKAIAIKPDYAQAYSNRGAVLKDLKQFDSAVASYDKAIAIKPDHAEAYYNRGIAQQHLKQLDAAVESYDKAIAIKPDIDFAFGMLLHTRMQLCDWQDADVKASELFAKIERGGKATPPLPVLALTDSLSIQRKAAQTWALRYTADAQDNIAKRVRRKRIRVGYFSMDFRNHPVSYLLAELLEIHSRDNFEVYAFSFGPSTKDAMRLRIEGACENFIDIQNKSEKEIVKLSREIGIDIAIDLSGFTQDSRPGIFTRRAAPIQVNFIGYPGTMAATYIDYIIADRHVLPEHAKDFYSEKVVYLPCFQPNDSKRKISAKTYTRRELGLPEDGFVFCSFNNSYKITPSVFDGWIRILKQVKDSVLFLYADNETVAIHLRKEALQRGLDVDRLVFGGRLPAPDYLARYRSADLFLDTYPFNGGTTASDSLWAGLPVLTCTGEAFASRMAASLLNAIDLPELITATQEGYEALAIELATNPERLKVVKDKLVKNRQMSFLFDAKQYARHIEDAYKQMYERYHSDMPPDHIYTE